MEHDYENHNSRKTARNMQTLQHCFNILSKEIPRSLTLKVRLTYAF
jgi:hypothetical protein